MAKKDVAPTPKKKVAILGFTPHRDMAPFDNPEFEIWTVNNLYKFVPRTDRIFQIHHPRHLVAPHHGQDGQEQVEFLRTTEIPVYMQEHYEDIPASVRFPIEELSLAFGVNRPDGSVEPGYWTNSISFMIALAIHEGFEEIHVYGVDMAVGTEYEHQRPSCEYFIGIARGRGIKVVLPAESDLLKARFIYGYQEEQRRAWDLKVERTVATMMERKAQSDAAARAQQSVSDKYEGAITAVREMQKTWE